MIKIQNTQDHEIAEINQIIRRSKSFWSYDENYLNKAIPLIQLKSNWMNEIKAHSIYHNDKLSGFIAFIPKGQCWELEHLWIDPSSIKKGLGKFAINFLRDLAIKNQIHSISILPDPSAEGFYIKMGAIYTGESKPSRIEDGPRFNEMTFRLKSNHKHDSIIFDLDGTLWDASPTTAAAWSAVAADLGLELVIDEQSIKNVSGLPFDKCVEARFGDYAKKIPHLYSTLDQAEKEAIIRHGGRLYPGVTDGLKILSKEYKLLIVSNCQDWYLEAFLNHSGLRHYFQDTLCFGQTGQSKQENIQEIVKRNDLKNSIYVGDTHWDHEAATAAGVAFEFVTYGFGSVNLDNTRRSDSFSSLTTKLSSTIKQG